MRYQAILFDIDGTLVDSERLLAEAFTAALVELGYPTPGPNRIEGILRCTNEQAMAYLNAPDIQPIIDALHRHQDRLRHLSGLYPGAAELVRACKELGLKLGVVTSRSRFELEDDPALTNLLPLFDACACEDDTANHKPSPDPTLFCLARLGLPASAALYLGDSPADCGSALAAGVDFALATWGCPTPRPEPYKYAPAKPLALLDILRAADI